MNFFILCFRTAADIGVGCGTLVVAFNGIYRKRQWWVIAIRFALLAVAATYILQEHNVIQPLIPGNTLLLIAVPLIFFTILTATREPIFWKRVEASSVEMNSR